MTISDSWRWPSIAQKHGSIQDVSVLQHHARLPGISQLVFLVFLYFSDFHDQLYYKPSRLPFNYSTRRVYCEQTCVQWPELKVLWGKKYCLMESGLAKSVQCVSCLYLALVSLHWHLWCMLHGWQGPPTTPSFLPWTCILSKHQIKKSIRNITPLSLFYNV